MGVLALTISLLDCAKRPTYGTDKSYGKSFLNPFARNKDQHMQPRRDEYLSEPPTSYRKPAPTAPINGRGVDEAKSNKNSTIWPF